MNGGSKNDGHVIMPKKLAHALMESGMQHYDSGGLIGGLSNMLGSNNNFQAAGANNQSMIENQYGQQQDIYKQQQTLASQLLAQTQGGGPGNALIAQQGANLAAQQAATMAGVRGASANPGLVARNAALMGQQGQQQVLNAQAGMGLQSQNALANQYAQMAGQTLQGQSIAQGALAAQNTANASVAGQNAATNGKLAGGIIGGLSGGFFAHGGEIPKMNMGGIAPLMGMQQYGGGSLNLPAVDFGGKDKGGGGGGGGMLSGMMGMFGGAAGAGGGSMDGMAMAGGPMDSVSNQYASPGADDPFAPKNSPAQMAGQMLPLLAMASHGGQIPLGQMLAGGAVPGQASVKGDSEENDNVPTLLSPGEVVIPRSIAQHPDAPEKAAEFIRHLKSNKRGYGGIIEARKGGC